MTRKARTLADPVASQWIKSSPFIQKTVGDIRSLDFARAWTKADFGFDGEWSGRLHYVVHGSKSDADLLVLWRKKASETSAVVEKVQWIDTKGFDTIWP